MIRAVCQLLIAFLVCDTAVYLFSKDKEDLIWQHQQGIVRLVQNHFQYIPRECVAQTEPNSETDDQPQESQGASKQ